MKRNYRLFRGLTAILTMGLAVLQIQAQSFKSGSFNLSLSGGSTTANFSTKNLGTDGTQGSQVNMEGIRDPLMLEYGISNHIGIGISTGTDIFKVDPSKFYGFSLPSQKPIEMYTSELNFDFNYHIYSNDRFDFSTFTSIGAFSVYTNGVEKLQRNDENLSDDFFTYNYRAKGRIVRTGTRAKFYVWRRVGFMSMLSVYSGMASPKRVSGNTVGNNYTTRITGYATEFGICFKLR